MEPKIRVKRYNTRSRHVRRRPRRRGTVATGTLVVLILIVAALAVSVALSPSRDSTSPDRVPKNTPISSRRPDAGGREATSAEAPGETLEEPSEAGSKSRVPESISSVSVDPKVITPSTTPNSTGDNGLEPVANIAVAMSRPATVSVRVLDSFGTTVRRVFTGRLEAGNRVWEWNGKNNKGDAVPSGSYVVRAQVLSSGAPEEEGTYLESGLDAISFITIGNRRRKAVALTIDDGWSPDMRIVDYLKKERVPATAFLIGGRGVVDENPGFVRALMKAGMEIANHTYDHEWLTNQEPSEIRNNILRGQAVISKITGYNRHWVRPSGGSLSTTVLRVTRANGYRVVQWTIDSSDSRGGATEENVQDTLSSVTNGSIILTHFGGTGTYEYIRKIVPAIRKKGYKFVTMSDLMEGVMLDQEDIPPAKPFMRALKSPALAPISRML